MTIDEFTALVREMRDAQKTYFRRKTYDDLVRSKDLERRVDAALKDFQKPQYPDLFASPEP